MTPISTGYDWDFDLIERYDTAIAAAAAGYGLDTYANQIEIISSEHGKVVFDVAIDATKLQIKEAVEGLFQVKVKDVNTLIRKGKVKRFRNVKGVRNNVKKAIVTLVDGQSIDISTGV